MEDIIKDSLLSKANTMREQAAELEQYSFDVASLNKKALTFKFSDLNFENNAKPDFLKMLPRKGDWLYVFTTKMPEVLMDGYKNIPNETFLNSKFSRDNKCEIKEAIYVGSSTLSLRERIKGHLGYSSNGTYSLNLNKYKCVEDIEFELTYFDVKGGSAALLQNMEDALWEELKPMFGKPGSNNKIRKSN